MEEAAQPWLGGLAVVDSEECETWALEGGRADLQSGLDAFGGSHGKQ
jgi:hypothetical protein